MSKNEKGEVSVISRTYSEYEYDGRSREDKSRCVSCNSGRNGKASRCPSCIKTVKLSDGKFFKAQYNCANCAHYNLNGKKCNNKSHPFNGEHRNPYDCACICGFKDLY